MSSLNTLRRNTGSAPALDAQARECCRRWYEEHGEAVYNYVRFQDDREIVSLRYGSGLGAAKSRRCSASARQTCGPVSGAHSEAADLITIRHCCLDFDGGGPDDDGLLVLGVPPDRVMMAALYEETPGRARSSWLLR